MLPDEILEEIHKIREEHVESFNCDLNAMFADWQKKQAESDRTVVKLSAKRDLRLKCSRSTSTASDMRECDHYKSSSNFCGG
ncbi:hypothetical protein NCWK1_2054 [Nostoc cycadae WK-1]|uniref:Uncharacterized protein n=1 Tax=Nostoc cycadae WK-1 TaxID=1861711 RepID=A0A2H6LGF3_9NOSO|nr:hypothetical protein NCWK1_2054 [Nostoc cycadae WK-1]